MRVLYIELVRSTSMEDAEVVQAVRKKRKLKMAKVTEGLFCP